MSVNGAVGRHGGAKLLPFIAPDLERRDGGVEDADRNAPRQGGNAPSRRLVTVLFTDIVESTRWASALGDRRWLELHAQHESRVRRAVHEFGGSCLRSTGDGFVTTFPSAMAAVFAAHEIIAATRQLGLEVRTALHIGECEIRGRRAAGIAFHICARIVALAGASEVLVSRTVRDVSAGSAVAFSSRGTHELKGLPGTWELYRAEPGPGGYASEPWATGTPTLS